MKNKYVFWEDRRPQVGSIYLNVIKLPKSILGFAFAGVIRDNYDGTFTAEWLMSETQTFYSIDEAKDFLNKLAKKSDYILVTEEQMNLM